MFKKITLALRTPLNTLKGVIFYAVVYTFTFWVVKGTPSSNVGYNLWGSRNSAGSPVSVCVSKASPDSEA